MASGSTSDSIVVAPQITIVYVRMLVHPLKSFASTMNV
jgi:hypothetical protein